MTRPAAGIASLVAALRTDRRVGWTRVAGSLDAFGVRGQDAAALRRLIRSHIRALPRRVPGADGPLRSTYSRRTPEPRPAVPGWHHAGAWRELYALRRKYGPRGLAEPSIHDRGTAVQRRRRNERLRAILRRERPVECEHRGVAWEDDVIARFNARRLRRTRGQDGKRGASRARGSMMEVPRRAGELAGWLRVGMP